MPHVPHVALAEHLHEALLRAIKIAAVAGRRDRPPVCQEEQEDLDEDLALFADYDAGGPRGRCYFSFGEAERRSRRLDMRGPLDRDPGPIPMTEALPDEDAVELVFGEGAAGCRSPMVFNGRVE